MIADVPWRQEKNTGANKKRKKEENKYWNKERNKLASPTYH
jgi:hypothetical protein